MPHTAIHTPAAAKVEHAALIVAFEARDLTGTDRDRAAALVAACDGCAELLADLTAIRVATAHLPAPRRVRDYRLTEVDAARCRPSLRNRVLGWLAAPRSSVRPLAGGLAALGMAGLLLATTPNLLSTSSTAMPAAAATAGDAANDSAPGEDYGAPKAVVGAAASAAAAATAAPAAAAATTAPYAAATPASSQAPVTAVGPTAAATAGPTVQGGATPSIEPRPVPTDQRVWATCVTPTPDTSGPLAAGGACGPVASAGDRSSAQGAGTEQGVGITSSADASAAPTSGAQVAAVPVAAASAPAGSARENAAATGSGAVDRTPLVAISLVLLLAGVGFLAARLVARRAASR